MLEVGFGSGALLEALRVRGNDVYGVDAGRVIVDKAKEAGYENVFLVDVSEEPLPFTDDFFDAVYCYEVVEHLTNPHRLLSEIRRVLKRGANLFLSVPAQEIDMGYGLLRHTFVYPGLLERPNFERFLTQMYFEIQETIAPGATEWLVGHNYILRNIKPDDRKDVVDVIIGDYSVQELYHDVLSPERLAEEMARELGFYEQMVEDYLRRGACETAVAILRFLLPRYPSHYDFFLRCSEFLLKYGRYLDMKDVLKAMLAAGKPPMPVMGKIATLLRAAAEDMENSSVQNGDTGSLPPH